MVFGSKEWEEYRYKKIQEELKNEKSNNYKIDYKPIYVFDDNIDEDIVQTRLENEKYAKIYSKYVNLLKDFYIEFKEWFNPIFSEHYIKGYENIIQCDKNIVDRFKFRFYHILFDIYKDIYGNNSLDNFFLQFVDNVDNDMQGAARCINNMEKFHFNLLNEIGTNILCFDNKGRWFESFRDKCFYLDKENS